MFWKIKTVGIAAGLALLAGTAQAADRDQSTAYDWTGLYVGGVGSYTTGDDTWSDGPYDLDDSFFGGVFAGYNQQFGNVVLSAEIVGQFGKMKETEFPTLWYQNMVDVKARLGFAFDRALVYVASGYSIANIEEDGGHFSMDGYNIGGGVDFAATENLIFGVEYSYRNVDGTCIHDEDVEGNVSSFQARASYKF